MMETYEVRPTPPHILVRHICKDMCGGTYPYNGEVLSSVALDAGAAGKWPYYTDIAFPPQTLTPVSEPGSAALIGVGLLALVAGARARRFRIGPAKVKIFASSQVAISSMVESRLDRLAEWFDIRWVQGAA